MKQLKFMLAAATAIGLASAAQAGYLSGSTDFETGTVESLFTYNGEPAAQNGDNESEIADGAAVGVAVGNNNFTGDKAKKLKVNTGTTPILRSVDGENGVELGSASVYIDTLVKFTVTPSNDPVEPTIVDGVVQDKLMIYLRDDGEDGTNLYTVAGYYDTNGDLKYGHYLIKRNVDPAVWHRLVVKAISDISSGALGGMVPGFQIYLDGTAENNLCVSENYYADVIGNFDGEYGAFLSMQANASVSSGGLETVELVSVGFAGEGEVDDLVISTFDPAKTVIDFTLALAGDLDGVSGDVTYTTSLGSDILGSSASTVYCYSDNDQVTVTYTPVKDYTATWSAVGEGATAPTSNTFVPVKGAAYTLTFAAPAPTSFDFTFTGDNLVSVTYTIDDGTEATANKGASITVEGKTSATVKVKAIKLDPLYVVADESATKVNDEYEVGDDASLVVTAKALTGDTGAMVPEGTTAADIGIENSAFASADTDQLNALVKWATASGKGSLELVNSMEFNGDEPTDANAKAFLLDCAPGEVDSEDDKFKLTITFDDQGNPVVEGPNGAATYKNGKIVLKGRTSLSEGDWEAKTSGHKFFKAFLTK